MGLLESTETHPDAKLAEMPKNYTYVLLRTLLSVDRQDIEASPTYNSQFSKQKLYGDRSYPWQSLREAIFDLL